MAESRQSSLLARLAEEEAKHNYSLEQKYNAVDQVSVGMEERIGELQLRIRKSKENVYVEIGDFEAGLKQERDTRVGLDTTKYTRGNQSGATYRESLVHLETGIATKLDQEKVTISGYHEKVKSEYQAFKEKHDQLKQQMPDSYIQGANEYKEHLVLKSLEKERYLTDVDTYIKQQNEAQAANRIALANSLEVHIQERTAQIESFRYQLKMWTDMKKYNIQQRLGVVAAQLGLVTNIRT